MPTLPTITVTQPQADRMLAAYGDAATYKRWLAEQIKAFVIQKETSDLRKAAEAQVEQTRVNISTELQVDNP